MNPSMIVPDEAENLIASFGLSDVIFNELRNVIDQYIPENYQLLRMNRPADYEDEMFVYTRIIIEGDVRHIFTMFIDDASANDHLFLRDIAYRQYP